VLPDPDFRASARDLESAYLESDDPERQSGFSGGRTRWVVERSPLVEALHREGDFLDVGCANGLLAADVMTWARGRGVSIVAHGVDLGPRLIELARQRLPQFASNFYAPTHGPGSPTANGPMSTRCSTSPHATSGVTGCDGSIVGSSRTGDSSSAHMADGHHVVTRPTWSG